MPVTKHGALPTRLAQGRLKCKNNKPAKIGFQHRIFAVVTQFFVATVSSYSPQDSVLHLQLSICHVGEIFVVGNNHKCLSKFVAEAEEEFVEFAGVF